MPRLPHKKPQGATGRSRLQAGHNARWRPDANMELQTPRLAPRTLLERPGSIVDYTKLLVILVIADSLAKFRDVDEAVLWFMYRSGTGWSDLRLAEGWSDLWLAKVKAAAEGPGLFAVGLWEALHVESEMPYCQPLVDLHLRRHRPHLGRVVPG